MSTPIDIVSNYYVYGLIDPRTNLPFYIGKGKKYKSGNERWQAHLIPGYHSAKNNKKKHERILEIRSLGLEPAVCFYYGNRTSSEAYDLETMLIDEYKRIKDGGILTNVFRDRRPPGMVGRKHKESSIELMKNSAKTRPPISILTREKMRDSHWYMPPNITGFKHSEKECADRSERALKRFEDNPQLKNVIADRMSRNWEITDPNGEISIIKNLFDFARKQKLAYTTIRYSRANWKCKEIKNAI